MSSICSLKKQAVCGGVTVPGSRKAAAVRSGLPGSGRSVVVADNRRNPRLRVAKDSADRYIVKGVRQLKGEVVR